MGRRIRKRVVKMRGDCEDERRKRRQKKLGLGRGKSEMGIIYKWMVQVNWVDRSNPHLIGLIFRSTGHSNATWPA